MSVPSARTQGSAPQGLACSGGSSPRREAGEARAPAPLAGGREDLRAAGSERKPACSACRLRPRGARGGSVLPSSPARREPRGLRRGWPGGAGLFIVALVKSDPWKGAGVPADRGLSAVCPGASPPSRRDWGLRPARLPRVRTARNPGQPRGQGAGTRPPPAGGAPLGPQQRSAPTTEAAPGWLTARQALADVSSPSGPRRLRLLL